MIIKAPYKPEHRTYSNSVFLAGSIEMGKADNWQARVEKLLPESVTIYNPRRDNWDSSWKQTKDNPNFREQVDWELDALAWVEIVAMYFDPNTKSPISLLEFGLHHDKMIVCCPEGFWRKGNIDIVCERYGIPQAENLDRLVELVLKYFKHLK